MVREYDNEKVLRQAAEEIRDHLEKEGKMETA
jgi:phosphopantothenate synthetase